MGRGRGPRRILHMCLFSRMESEAKLQRRSRQQSCIFSGDFQPKGSPFFPSPSSDEVLDFLDIALFPLVTPPPPPPPPPLPSPGTSCLSNLNTFAKAVIALDRLKFQIQCIRNISFIIALDGHYGGGEHLFINIEHMGQYFTILVHFQ